MVRSELPDSPLSLWLAEYGEYQPEAPLRGDIEVDVAIIGGGYTGMATAIALKRRDPSLGVAVLRRSARGVHRRGGARMRQDSPRLSARGHGAQLRQPAAEAGRADDVARVRRHELDRCRSDPSDGRFRAWRHLDRHVHWLWPHLAEIAIKHRWGGPFSFTADLTPALGYVGDDRDAVYALGCIGHGVSMSYRNGQVLAELLLRDRDEAVKECPFVNRRAIPWPGEPLASVAKHALRNYLRAEDALHEKVLARVARGVE